VRFLLALVNEKENFIKSIVLVFIYQTIVSMNERTTENLTKKLLLAKGYQETSIEEQISANPNINKLLQGGSKG
jgi:hypothetical protein